MFKDFYLKDIFGSEPIRGTRLTKEHRISGNIPLITAGEQNEGVAEYISNQENQTLSNMLTIDMFGNCFYRDYLYKSDDNILSFGLNGKSTEEMLYIASIINSVCKTQYNYAKQYRKGSYLETTIPLPVIESPDPGHEYTVDDIDWQSMQSLIAKLEQDYIAEIEQERVAELDAYLIATGLDNYELTDEDKEILYPSTIQLFKEFDLSVLFDISTTKSVDKNKLDFVADGEYDFIGRTSVNWGIQGKLHKLSFEPNPKDSFSLVQVGKTVALWREKEWYASQNLFLLNPKIDKIKENKLYFQGVINKEMSRYGKEYNIYPTLKSLAETKILLPVIESPDPDHEYTPADIDWHYMERYIRATEKLAIADVVRYKNASIEAAKKIVDAK